MPTSRHHKRSAYAWAVVSVWLAGTAYAFWSFELKHQRSFESARTVLFDSGSRARAAEAWFRAVVAPGSGGGSGRVATVVHIYSANCPCNRFTQPHLAAHRRELSTPRCEFRHSGTRVYRSRVDRSNTGGAGFRRRGPARLLRTLQRQRPLWRVRWRPGGACARAGSGWPVSAAPAVLRRWLFL